VAPILSFVRGVVPAAAVGDVVERYRAGLADERPEGLEASWLLRGADGTVAVATLWRDPAALDALRASGEEPFARRLIREAGGSPSAEFFDVLESASD
jgi:hypothetical protein